MIPAQITSIKQNLNKAYGLFKPKLAAIERFKTNLLSLVVQQSPEESEEQLTAYLANILQGTFLEYANEETQNSSPVCYATISGLREGFEDPFLTDVTTPFNPDNKTLPASALPSGKTILPPYLKEALHLTKLSVSTILRAKTTESPAETTILENRINELVYQLYELTPEEIKLVEAS
ncbi:hypothetical protein AAE02nite_43330 [Adhaeribacter aerolatus]|uniref:DUF7149 domain-containing protein n=1 Tax=Adhaeribacter aerolatus TaxID=670289 RepID=A0A512B3X9_9BACT|nr:hypothetical protein [Adhaeribacter aerolatus]GEO06669.1 hypothetical protein AAE02nite_43330 [Adhaeribacter aerolatus]